MTVTITTTKLIIEENGIQLRFDGRDIIKAVPEPINATLPAKVRAVQPQSQAFCVVLHLTGDAREALGSTYIIRLLDVTGHPAWTDDQAGADTAASEIAVMIRSASGGAGGGQVDSVVAGDAIDVDATDPANPIVSVKVDGVTIGFNGSNELEVPAGGGGYVPTTRLINTTAPLTGGGDLSVNRTIAIPQATAVTDGFLDSADWSLFNSKVSSVGATYPIQSSGGATPVISADTSTGGNGAADDGKVLIFGTEGDITGSSVTGLNAVQGIAAGNGVGVYGENNGTGPAVAGTATAGGVGGAFTATGAEGVTGTSDSEPGVRATNSSTTEAALHVNNNDPTNTGDIAAFHRNDNLGVEIRNDGGLDWTSASGAQTTANNLPVFSALNQGVVPAAGAVPSAANFLTETGIFAAPSAGSIAGAQALTRTDDTNVTLTLGGTPATALLQATSLTLGWSGQLSISRGGTGQSTQTAAFDALSPATTKGDLIAHDGTDNIRVGVGSNGQRLVASSAATPGVAWQWNETRITLYAGQNNVTMTNQPNSAQIQPTTNPNAWATLVDLTNAQQVRFGVRVAVGSASANSPRLILRYFTSLSATASDWLDIGTSEVSASLTSTGIIRSAWINITALAKADVYVTIISDGGNGTADPEYSAPFFETR